MPAPQKAQLSQLAQTFFRANVLRLHLNCKCASLVNISLRYEILDFGKNKFLG